MELCERIQSLRHKRNMTQKELSKLIGVSTVSINKWETGDRKPSADAIVSLTQTFNVTSDYLLGLTADPKRDDLLLSRNEENLLSDYRSLDKYGKNAVKSICFIEKSRVDSQNAPRSETLTVKPDRSEPLRYIPKYITPSAAGLSAPLDGDDFEMIPVDSSVPSNADFAVRIQGDSMFPYINDGDTVYVKKGTELSIGDVGIFCVDGAMYCKQYYVDGDKNLVLLSANPLLKHTNIFVSADGGSNVKCYGKVLLERRLELPEYIYEN